MRAAISPNTTRAYAAQWRVWTAYAESFRASVMPAEPIIVANWLAERARGNGFAEGDRWGDGLGEGLRDGFVSHRKAVDIEGDGSDLRVDGLEEGSADGWVPPLEPVEREGYESRPRDDGWGRRRGGRSRTGMNASPATLRCALSAIKFAHLAAGLSFDTAHPAIRLVLQGIVRTHSKPPRQAAPLRRETVQALITELEDDVASRRDAALLALGYCFGRRRSELAQLDYEHIGTGSGALKVTRSTLEVRIIRSKNNARVEEEVYAIPLPPNTVAADAVTRWITIAGIEPGQPFFRRVYKSGRVGAERLDPQSIGLIIKRRLREHYKAAGLSEAAAERAVAHYSGHSLRVGLAVASAEAGASVLAIQNALGHKTPVMSARYARAAERTKTSPHLLPGVALSSDRPVTRRKRRKRG